MTTNLTEAQILDSIKLTISKMQLKKEYFISPDYWQKIEDRAREYRSSIMKRTDYKIIKNQLNQVYINNYLIDYSSSETLALSLSLSLPFTLDLSFTFTLAFICGYLEGLESTQSVELLEETKPYLDLY